MGDQIISQHSSYSGETIDDLMHKVYESILEYGKPINPTKGPTKEITGILLELKNPRARLSRTETRGKVFSCLGELCWYLAGNDELEFIKYYIPKYDDCHEQGIIHGAYGPRLFNRRGEVDPMCWTVFLDS